MTFDRLDLVSKLYQPAGWPRVLEAAAGKRTAGPLVVDLDPTTFCDLACPECISGKLLNQGRFTPERLAELAGELIEMSVRGVVLIGGGEPLAHRGTRQVLRVLGEAGVAIGVVTNGTMIQQNLDELAAYASWVRVSMDAGTKETYGRFRPDRKGRSVFDKVVGNMRLLAEVKKGALGYSFLVMTRREPDGTVVSNHHEVLEAAGLAKDIGCDYFETKAMFDDGHHVIQVADGLLRSVDEQLAEAERRWADGSFEIINSSTLTSLRNRVGPMQPKEYHRCKVTELRTLITPSGVYVCSYHRGNAQARIGDAVTERLPDIWENSDRGIVDPTRDCRFHCARHRSNLELDKIATGTVPPPEPGTDEDPFI
ncbi:radical SAM protein [Streptomyces clavuligerus]|uniref:radical SAM protein n=1 Tax=Streptomyces clavuligerus TaxID=1901 RepID=UPI000810BD75|nr:radical SAM protein [Streptomyces clavuligerus]ANW17091.1 radical SAM protein [Streptomyces clavuligerus]AXU11630.1 radical SAM protein [Streptomyces clavuligerus]QPL61751.1 radical SAM protein [Streptomyces clavuligerus]QPL67784.1 radical SAM protein [Streptomyces clavuligerus]QPL73860.1 radical SAM protein [Streptomyces clavuligerus]